MQVTLHQTHHTIADFQNIFNSLKDTVERQRDSSDEELHVFPELFLTGYPLQDLCLNKSFIQKYQKLLSDINHWSRSLVYNKNQIFLIGGIHYFLCESGHIEKMENVIFKLSPGEELEPIYTKRLLPNYDIFDEKKYFSPGSQVGVLDFANKKIGLLLCEDMWPSSAHAVNPVELLKTEEKFLDLVVNLSASPFDIFKTEKRIARAKEIVDFLSAPFVYVNRVGGEDEVLFDGRSFYIKGEEVVVASSFRADELSFTLSNERMPSNALIKENIPSTWEGLFTPKIEKSGRLTVLCDKKNEDIIQALCFGLQEYARKSYFKKFVIALSGGMDSALVLTVVKLSLKKGQELEAVYMPSEFSRDISESLSKELCKKLEVPLKILPIKNVHTEVRNEYKEYMGEALEGLADENIQSRLRGALIYARSNQAKALVINTSNKSELAVGYSTIYGDSVGAISLLGDLYKSEVFALARFINQKYNNLIPEKIITRPPSAELREDQKDTDSLPAYERLDAILEGILSYKMTSEDLIKLGHSKEEVLQVVNLYRKSEYKRSQFCPIIKVKSKSFGFGYRVPLSKKSDFYL